MHTRLQVALDHVDLARALHAAAEAVRGGVHLLEVGTPLLKAEGLAAIRALRARHPQHEVVCDAKTMDAGRLEVEAAAKAGASIATVLGVASDSTIRECIEAGRNQGIHILVDLLGCADPAARARDVAAWGAWGVNVHCPIDEQVRGLDPFATLRSVRAAVDVVVTVAGGLTVGTIQQAVTAGADIAIVGGAITKARDAEAATRDLLAAMAGATGAAGETAIRARREEELAALFRSVSTANLSDALHRRPSLAGLIATQPDVRIAGRVRTVRTLPGDWAKPVEAIDRCGPGEVLLVDAGGVPPAVWGELATHSAVQRGLEGVIVWGAIRDTADIRRLAMPVFARAISSHAGEPKGFGEIDVALRLEGLGVAPGDWVVADSDGAVFVSRAEALEAANRAMYCLEAENRLRAEIVRDGRTLAEVAEIYKWEKRMAGMGAPPPPGSDSGGNKKDAEGS